MSAVSEARTAGAHATRRAAAKAPAVRTNQREPGLKQAHLDGAGLPALLLFPQLAILLIFFFIPAIRALAQAFLLADPFGNSAQFVWFDNFTALFRSADYRNSIWVTLWFTLAQNLVTILVAGLLAFATNHILHGRGVYRASFCSPMPSRRRSPAFSGPISSIPPSARSPST